jgi:hypothetical protein
MITVKMRKDYRGYFLNIYELLKSAKYSASKIQHYLGISAVQQESGACASCLGIRPVIPQYRKFQTNPSIKAKSLLVVYDEIDYIPYP